MMTTRKSTAGSAPMMTHFQASTEKTLLNEDATVAEETDASDVMAGQQRSGDQISILRQAASILHIPITDLPAALIARESPPSVAKTDAEDSGLPFVEHSGSETNETHHIPLWPWDNLNWDFDALSELEQAPEHRLSTTHFEANINSLYQGLILPELWHQDSSEALQSILPLDPDSSLRNPELQPDYDSSIALGLSEPAGGSNLVAENTGVLPDLIRIGSQHINFGDVFDMNAYSGSGQHSSMYAHTALLESTFDAAEAFPGPNSSMNALPIPVPMSGESDEVYGSPRNDDLQLVDKLHTLQPPYMPSGSDVPVLGNSSSSTSSSSWVITTPSPEKEKSPESNSISSNQGIARGLAASGPCRYIWELRTRGARRNDQTSNQRKRRGASAASDAGRRRRPFHDQQVRAATALTRQLKACLRCRIQRIRCDINPGDPHGDCLTCLRLSGLTISRLPCLRYKITGLILYREQSAPNPIWTRRWKSMDIQNITEWASPEIKTIEVSPLVGRTYKVEVREFIPTEGDMLDEFWSDGGVVKAHRMPPYALVNLDEAANARKQFVYNNFGSYIRAMVDKTEPLIWNTYVMAFKYSREAPREEERTLLRNSLRLWAVHRITSNHVPKPPVMSAQFQAITYTKILRPLNKIVLDQLHALTIANKRRNWFTIYLTLFVLLHSCAMLTRRNEEYARQILLKTQYANPRSISEIHRGALVLLAYFHYCNKGQQPFTLAQDPAHLHEFADAAELTAMQVQFVQQTLVFVRARCEEMRKARQEHAFGNDWYFVSQLYEKDWKPSATG